MMRLLPFVVLFPLAVIAAEKPPVGVPEGYQLLYQSDFTMPDARKAFAFPDPAAWRITDDGGTLVLEQHKAAKYAPPYRSPFNFCLIRGQKFGDFVMDVECQQTSKEYGHRDMVFVYGYQSPSRYYYTHIATKTDDYANQCFIVHDAPRTKISTATNPGNDWGPHGTWKTVRIVRNATDGRTRVYFGDLTKPIMEAKDKTFAAGWVGFGSFDDTCKVRSVRVWGQSADPTPAGPMFAPAK